MLSHYKKSSLATKICSIFCFITSAGNFYFYFYLTHKIISLISGIGSAVIAIICLTMSFTLDSMLK